MSQIVKSIANAEEHDGIDELVGEEVDRSERLRLIVNMRGSTVSDLVVQYDGSVRCEILHGKSIIVQTRQ